MGHGCHVAAPEAGSWGRGRGRARTPNPREVSEESQLGVLPANASTVTGECWLKSHKPAGCLALDAWVGRNIK